ncbi:gp149 [Bacillus phage G]|uniref:Gp149 n=1 Tax=Bacillus phage G TaxID=2884420 RepID=G3MBL5_9CAUD|nr:gp149 [Bacillus phage G]AEO93409.1 gp149 [Bacillus phage G]
MAEYSFADSKYESLAQDLIDADPIDLGHIDVSAIAFLNKEEKNPKWPFRIIPIREPLTMLTKFEYYVEICESLLENATKEHIELHIYKILRQIDKESGRIIHPNVIEFSDIIDLFGYDWQEKKMLPSIIDQLDAKTVANTLVGNTSGPPSVI